MHFDYAIIACTSCINGIMQHVTDDRSPQQFVRSYGTAACERGQGRRGVQPGRTGHCTGRRQPCWRQLQQVMSVIIIPYPFLRTP